MATVAGPVLTVTGTVPLKVPDLVAMVTCPSAPMPCNYGGNSCLFLVMIMLMLGANHLIEDVL